MIAGLEDISQGDLYIGARRVNDVAPKDRDIAMVFQNYALYPHMSVYDNMAFSLKLHHLSKAEIDERVRKAAEMLGLADYLARKPKALSGGQRQRVALGRSLVREPQVFLLDEPLSNLDAKLRVQTRTEIARLHQQTGTTFVYVTHDQVEAMTMGDRIAVLNAGLIQQLGTPQELYDTPANLFVAGFIGSPAMNFFHARLAKARDGQGVTLAFPAGGGADARLIPVSPRLASKLAGRASGDGGLPVIAGIRPEHLRLAADAGGDGALTPQAGALAGTADVVEHLGNEQLLYAKMAGVTLPGAAAAAREQVGEEQAATGPSAVARLGPDARVQPGDRVALAPDPDRIHVFDPESQERLA
jgi:multiple sugar transport system ATP-binding protein